MNRDERQALAIEKWVKVKGRGTFCFSTGFGKTKTALDAIERIYSKNPNKTISVVVVVPTKVLQDQWLEKLDERDLLATVLVMNTAAKKPFRADFLIIDECQHISANYMSNVFNNCKPKFILGLTATYERLDGREKEVLDKYAPVCDTVTIEDSIQNGWLSPYREYKVLLDVDLTEYDKANKEFLQHFAFFSFDFATAMNCVTNFWAQQVYAKQIGCTMQEVKAHAFAWNRALRFRKTFIANHPKKLEIAKKILENRQNCKAITFNSSIKRCEEYGFGYVMHSGKTKKKNQLTVDEFNKVDTGVLHTSKMADEGLDIKGLNLAIIAGFNSSKIAHVQRAGRCLRVEPGKETEIFTLVLRNTVEQSWFAKSTEDMEYIEINEQELDFILKKKNLDNKTKQKQEKTNEFRF